MASVAMNIPKP